MIQFKPYLVRNTFPTAAAASQAAAVIGCAVASDILRKPGSLPMD